MLLRQARGGRRPTLLRRAGSGPHSCLPYPRLPGPHRPPPGVLPGRVRSRCAAGQEGSRPLGEGWLRGGRRRLPPARPPATRGAGRGNGWLLRQRLPAGSGGGGGGEGAAGAGGDAGEGVRCPAGHLGGRGVWPGERGRGPGPW